MPYRCEQPPCHINILFWHANSSMLQELIVSDRWSVQTESIAARKEVSIGHAGMSDSCLQDSPGTPVS